MLHMCLGEGYWVHSLTHLLSVFAPYPSSPIPEMSYTTQPIREARGVERENERGWETERQRKRETVRLLVGRAETPEEEGGHGLPGATYTPRPCNLPRGCVCVSVCCFYAPTCESACAFVATYVLSHCRLARPRPCSCRKGTCVKR